MRTILPCRNRQSETVSGYRIAENCEGRNVDEKKKEQQLDEVQVEEVFHRSRGCRSEIREGRVNPAPDNREDEKTDAEAQRRDDRNLLFGQRPQRLRPHCQHTGNAREEGHGLSLYPTP